MNEKMKKLFLDSEIKGVDENEKTITALVSTPTRDRMGEVVDSEGADLKNFKKNPVVLFSHNSFVPPIAKALWIKKDPQGLLSKMQFADTQIAQEIFSLYKDGFMKAFSIGFIPKEWTDGDGQKTPHRTFTKFELVEYSAVAVPANPDALTTAFDKGILKSPALIKSFEYYVKSIKPKPKTGEELMADVAKLQERVKELETALAVKKEKPFAEEIAALEADLIEKDERISGLTKELKDVRYKLYKALFTEIRPNPKTVSEMSDTDLATKIGDIVTGVIRKVTGKVD